MAYTNFEDISVVLSGGTTNINPNLSLGGDPASTPLISGTLNNLFDDILPNEARDGQQDYRCIYFFNDGEHAIFSVNLWISAEPEADCVIQIGVAAVDEIQRITLENGTAVTGGSFTVSFGTQQIVVPYNADLGSWAANFQTLLRSLTIDGILLLRDVVVSGQQNGTSIIFDVNFRGEDGRRNQPALALISNNLSPTPTISTAILQQGSPINTVAQHVGIETNPPGGVDFLSPDQSSPLQFPRLDPGEGFPLWIKRTILEGAQARENDGFSLRFSAEAFRT